MQSISRVSLHLWSPNRPHHIYLHRIKKTSTPPALQGRAQNKWPSIMKEKKYLSLNPSRLYYLSTIKEAVCSSVLSTTWPFRKLLVLSDYLWTFFPAHFLNVDTTVHLPSECPKVDHLNSMDTTKKIKGIYRSW